jgi:hypothetical protein
LRELVRHRAKLVGLRSHCKAEVHAVLAKCGVTVSMSDLFGVDGTALLDRLRDSTRLVMGPRRQRSITPCRSSHPWDHRDGGRSYSCSP